LKGSSAPVSVRVPSGKNTIRMPAFSPRELPRPLDRLDGGLRLWRSTDMWPQVLPRGTPDRHLLQLLLDRETIARGRSSRAP
jgi:hypothetical protein